MGSHICLDVHEFGDEWAVGDSGIVDLHVRLLQVCCCSCNICCSRYCGGSGLVLCRACLCNLPWCALGCLAQQLHLPAQAHKGVMQDFSKLAVEDEALLLAVATRTS